MRFLANENFPADAVSALREQGHDVAWIRTDSPGISDSEVLDRAQREDRILIRLTKILVNWLSVSNSLLSAELSYSASQLLPQDKLHKLL